MRKNKKASIISLEVLIGVVISIAIIVFAVTIISNFYRLSNSSKDSFNQLVGLIEKVNKNNPGTIQSIPLRMDKSTAIIGFTKDDEDFHFRDKQIGAQGGDIANSLFKKPVGNGCETNKACICLCRKLELDSEGEGGYVKCEDEYFICKVLDEIEFPNNLPQENKGYFRKNGFVISRSDLFPTKDYNSQFKEVSVQKYKEFDADDVAVCEISGTNNGLYDNCVPLAYKEEKKAISSLKFFKTFIESCKNQREFVNAEEPCSCGAFDFTSEIPEKYIVEFTESENQKLKLILKKDNKNDIIESVEVNTALCTYQPKLKDSDDLPKDKEIIISRETPAYYTHYKGNDEDYSFIVFVKNNEGNACILRTSERGYLGMYEDYSEKITFKSTIRKERGTTLGHEEINITGCKYSITEE